jgi:hypothetical protein
MLPHFCEVVVRKLNIKINEDMVQAIYFSHRCRPIEVPFTLKELDILSVNHTKYLGKFFD